SGEPKFCARQTGKVNPAPQNRQGLSEDVAETMLKLIGVLEDDDDVQNVYSNFEVSDDVLKRLTAA
ncbi:MAG: YebC/PmpR family DNA-binding transcriptional regulator, partial [Pseudomonadota bacterium]